MRILFWSPDPGGLSFYLIRLARIWSCRIQIGLFSWLNQLKKANQDPRDQTNADRIRVHNTKDRTNRLIPVWSSRISCARQQRRPLRSGGPRRLGSSPPGSSSGQPRIELMRSKFRRFLKTWKIKKIRETSTKARRPQRLGFVPCILIWLT